MQNHHHYAFFFNWLVHVQPPPLHIAPKEKDQMWKKKNQVHCYHYKRREARGVASTINHY
jgi:hypothetical protein